MKIRKQRHEGAVLTTMAARTPQSKREYTVSRRTLPLVRQRQIMSRKSMSNSTCTSFCLIWHTLPARPPKSSRLFHYDAFFFSTILSSGKSRIACPDISRTLKRWVDNCLYAVPFSHLHPWPSRSCSFGIELRQVSSTI